MPGLDGTGPTVKGPITGSMSRELHMSIPDNPDEPIRCFAGESGRPLLFQSQAEETRRC